METIRLVQIEKEYPEQYYVYDSRGNKIGFIRVRWGYCIAWCPDEGGEDEVYAARLKSGWWSFGSKREQKKHLRRACAAIIEWHAKNQP